MNKIGDLYDLGIWHKYKIFELTCHKCTCQIQQDDLPGAIPMCCDCNIKVRIPGIKYQVASCNLFVLKDIFESNDVTDSIGNWYDRLDFIQDRVPFRQTQIKCLDADKATFPDLINGLRHRAELIFSHKFLIKPVDHNSNLSCVFAFFHCVAEQNSYLVRIIDRFNQQLQYVSRSIVYSRNEQTFWENPFPTEICVSMEKFFNKMTTDMVEIHTATVVDDTLPVEVVKIICHTYAQIMIWKCTRIPS